MPMVGVTLLTLLVAVQTWSLLLICTTLVVLVFYKNRQWPAFTNFFTQTFVAMWCRLFQFEVICDSGCVVQEKQGYVLSIGPHGVVPLGAVLFMEFCWNKARHFYGSTGVASMALRIPFIRQIFLWCGMCEVSREELSRRAKYQNLCLFPGGIAEMLLTDRKQESVYIKGRLGMTRLARQHKLKIIPSYVFGATQCFDQLTTAGDTWLNKALVQYSRKLRTSLTWYWGPMFLPIPFPTKITFVIGSPIEFSEAETLEESHAKYVKAVRELYDKYRNYAGYGEKDLKIL